MWKIAFPLIEIMVLVLGITQVLLPILIDDMKFFWLVRPKPPKKEKLSFDEEVKDLAEKKKTAKTAEQSVEEKIDERYNQVKKLKDDKNSES